MNQRKMREAEKQMMRAEKLRQKAVKALTPQGHAAIMEEFEAAIKVGRELVFDARDSEPDEDEE